MKRPSTLSARPTRRSLLTLAGAVGATSAVNALLPPWARALSGGLGSLPGRDLTEIRGNTFDLAIGNSPFAVDGRRGHAVTINGTVPGPLLRFREGETVTLNVSNRLDEDTSIHWHGILLPPSMDGVPGVSFPGIKPGTTFRYHFPIKQAGTYWYHSHSGLQEQSGHYGPLVIDPAGPDPVGYDREYVIVLSDWSFEHPHRIFDKLKKMSDAYNFQQRTVGDFFRKASRDGLGNAIEDRAMWGNMRMMPTDIADVTGATYQFLINGHGPGDNWTALFEPGERVRLRFINASAMSIFNVRIPDLPMTVVQADGLNVRPVETDEFQIGTAETYDVVVQPEADRAFTLMAEANDRSGYGRATLAPRAGMEAAVPPLRERPLLTMKDMGMAGHGGMDHGDMKMDSMGNGAMDHGTMDHGAEAPKAMASGEMDHSTMDHGKMDQGAMAKAKPATEPMDHSTMDHGEMAPPAKPAADPHAGHDMGTMTEMKAAEMKAAPGDTMAMDMDMKGDMGSMAEHEHPTGPGVANTAMEPNNRLSERGVGLEDVPHRVLVYTDLVSLDENPDLRAPEREVEVHLTSNMERYMWSFDGVKFSEVKGPIVFHEGERLRLTMVNDTMMPHPIHLHGMFFDVVTNDGNHKPRKHTIIVKPAEKLSVDITADAVGNWAFHCHLLYHMHAGMFRVVSVHPRSSGAMPMSHEPTSDAAPAEHDHGHSGMNHGEVSA